MIEFYDPRPFSRAAFRSPARLGRAHLGPDFSALCSSAASSSRTIFSYAAIALGLDAGTKPFGSDRGLVLVAAAATTGADTSSGASFRAEGASGTRRCSRKRRKRRRKRRLSARSASAGFASRCSPQSRRDPCARGTSCPAPRAAPAAPRGPPSPPRGQSQKTRTSRTRACPGTCSARAWDAATAWLSAARRLSRASAKPGVPSPTRASRSPSRTRPTRGARRARRRRRRRRRPPRRRGGPRRRGRFLLAEEDRVRFHADARALGGGVREDALEAERVVLRLEDRREHEPAEERGAGEVGDAGDARNRRHGLHDHRGGRPGGAHAAVGLGPLCARLGTEVAGGGNVVRALPQAHRGDRLRAENAVLASCRGATLQSLDVRALAPLAEVTRELGRAEVSLAWAGEGGADDRRATRGARAGALRGASARCASSARTTRRGTRPRRTFR